MLTFSIKSRKHGEVSFYASKPGAYVHVGLRGCVADKLAPQACEGGQLSGHALPAPRQEDQFEAVCRRWWRAYLRAKQAE